MSNPFSLEQWIWIGGVWALLFVVLSALLYWIYYLHRRSVRSLGEVNRDLQLRLSALEKKTEQLQKEQSREIKALRSSLDRLESFSESHTRSRVQPTESRLDKRYRLSFLAEKGLPPQEISKRLHLYHGETELYLGLRRFASGGEAQ